MEGEGGGRAEFLLREIIALVISCGTNTNIGQKKWTKNIAFYLFTITV